MSALARCVVLGFALVLAPGVAAKETVWDRYPGEDQVRLEDRFELTLDPGGEVTLDKRVVYQALTEAGAAQLQSFEYDINHALQEFALVRACTVNLDGVEQCTNPADVVREPEEDADIIPGLVEPYQVVVPLTGVRVGSRVELEYRKTTRLGPDHRVHWSCWARSGRGPSEGLTVVVRSSPTRPLYGAVRGEAEIHTSQDGDTTVQTWVFGPQERPARDPNRPHAKELGPVLYLSEFQDWADFVAYYHPLADAARERFRGAPLRELEGLGEPRLAKLDPVIHYGTLLEDRAPVYSVGLSSATLVPGSMDTVVARSATEVDRAVALWTALTEAGVEAHLALASRYRVDQPYHFPCAIVFQDIGVWVEDRGFVHAEGHPDFVDVRSSARRGGAVVVLDPDGPRVIEGEVMDPPGHRPAWHKEGRLTISGGELRVHESLRFSGSAEAAARANWRSFQDEIEDEERSDKEVRRLYASHLAKYPDDKLSHVERATYAFLREKDYASGRIREARLFDPWDPNAAVEVRMRYVPEDALEQRGGLMLVHLPLEVEAVARKVVRARPDRDAPVKTTCWTYTHHYELVIPDGYELLGVPRDQEIENEWGSLVLRYREQNLLPRPDEDDDKGGELAPPLLSRDAPEDERTVPGVVITAEYRVHHNRVPVEAYPDFLQVAARHALSFTDPVILHLAISDD